MTILATVQNFFTPTERKMTTPNGEAAESTGERLEKLKRRQAEVRARVAAGTATEDEILEDKELRARVQAAAKVHSEAQRREKKAALAAATADFDKRVDANMTRIGGLVGRLLMEVQDTQRLIDEAARTGVGAGRSFPEIFGVPFEFARLLQEGIEKAAPGVTWNFDVCLGGEPKRPVLPQPVKPAPRPRYVTDMTGAAIRTDPDGRQTFIPALKVRAQ